jgi:hypothetical protein
MPRNDSFVSILSSEQEICEEQMAKFDSGFEFESYNFHAAEPVSFLGAWSEDRIELSQEDRVNSPSHYTRGTQEAIEIIEEAIDAAPTNQTAMLQAQVLKYLLRIWHKDNPAEDARKAQWYLNRLVDSLN